MRIAGHIIGQRLRRKSRFATVLQLEPLHTCNLTCTGCGRIREYSTSIKDVMPIEDCVAAARECEAPMVSICGGEPLIYPEIEELVDRLLADKRIVYMCTNGLAMRKKMRAALAWQWRELQVTRAGRGAPLRRLDARIQQLVDAELISNTEASSICDGSLVSNRTSAVLKPHGWFYWNVHLDGLEATHDLIVERQGVFAECIQAIRMAKILGYQVATNTTVYKESDMGEIEDLFRLLAQYDVDGHTISPGYDYDAAKSDMARRLGIDPAEFFLTRAETQRKFVDAPRLGREYPILGTPIYLDFLAGLRDLSCSAWAIPTRNIRGWKGPCYLMTDGHYRSYQELLEKTDWSRLGRPRGVAIDRRCENCMVHCGFEPSATLGIGSQPGDIMRNLAFNFGRKPAYRPVSPGAGSLRRDSAEPRHEGDLSAVTEK